jgi:membrane protease subunit (stomatin/prohibitin family)
VADPRKFFTQVTGTRQRYYASELEGQLRETIVARMTDILASSDVSFLDMAKSQAALGQKIAEQMKPAFAALGLELDQFVVESISLPEELTKVMDQRIGMSMAGDLSRFTQFEAAESLEEAATNTGGAAGMGVGLGAGAAMAQAVMAQAKAAGNGAATPVAAAAGTKFCVDCGKSIPDRAKYCPECGKAQ